MKGPDTLKFVTTQATTNPSAVVFNDENFAGEPFSDEELTALALACDLDAPIPDDAVALSPLVGVSPLPGWYMPAAVIRSSAAWHRPLIISVIAAFCIVDAFGLCSTYG